MLVGEPRNLGLGLLVFPRSPCLPHREELLGKQKMELK